MLPFSTDTPEYPIVPYFLPKGTKRRSGLKLDPVRFLVAHDTGNPGSTARGNVRYYINSANEIKASAHLFVDDREIIECIPAITPGVVPEKAWHVYYERREDNVLYGANANDAAIGVEYCYGGRIDADEAYRRYVWLLAYLCWRFRLDPARAIVGHYFLDPARRSDPVTGLLHSRRTYPQLLLDVADVYRQGTGVAPVIPTPPPAAPTLQVTAQGLLNIRRGEPFRRAPVARQVAAGTTLSVLATTVSGERVNGNDQWYALATGNEFCWSGAVR